jgi:hypothetical protein
MLITNLRQYRRAVGRGMSVGSGRLSGVPRRRQAYGPTLEGPVASLAPSSLFDPFRRAGSNARIGQVGVVVAARNDKCHECDTTKKKYLPFEAICSSYWTIRGTGSGKLAHDAYFDGILIKSLRQETPAP